MYIEIFSNNKVVILNQKTLINNNENIIIINLILNNKKIKNIIYLDNIQTIEEFKNKNNFLKILNNLSKNKKLSEETSLNDKIERF